MVTILPYFNFTCGNILLDVRDNNAYPTVSIGSQCWMAANLDFGQKINGSEVQRDNCLNEKYCFADLITNCSASGGLYQWDEIMQYEDAEGAKGICPPGWHIPTETEWITLFDFYISNGFAGSPLKYSGYSGFNALTDGVRFRNTSWSFDSFATLIWSSTPHGPLKAWAHGMNEQNPSVSFYPSARYNAFPVRCIKD